MKKSLKILVLNLATTALTTMTLGESPNISEASSILSIKLRSNLGESGRKNTSLLLKDLSNKNNGWKCLTMFDGVFNVWKLINMTTTNKAGR